MKLSILVGAVCVVLVGCTGTQDDDLHPTDDDDNVGDDDDIGPDDDDATGDDDTTPGPDDLDGDGFSPQQGDCDDEDASIYPGAPETPCDQVDSDCDGQGVGVEAVVDGVEYTTDADAVAAAQDGDTILLCPGVHTEQIYIDSGRVLGLGSWSGDPEDTVLDGQDDHTCLYLGLEAAIQVHDLTFQHGWAEPWIGGEHYGGGIMSFAQSLEVSNCVFRENYSVQTAPGVALYADDDLSSGIWATFEDTLFEDNDAVSHGGGVYGNGWLDLSLSFTRCSFSRNAAGSGGALKIEGRAPIELSIEESYFVDNSSASEGGAVSVGTPYATSTTVITDSSFTGNQAEASGGAVYAANQLSFELSGSDLTENIGNGTSGGGLYFRMAEEPSTATITGSIFASNRSGYEGGGLSFLAERSCSLLIEDSSFIGNVSDNSGGAMQLQFTHTFVPEWGSTVTMSDVELIDNHAERAGGGIETGGIGYLDLDHCTFQGNVASESDGPAIFISDDTGATFTDCLIDGNESPISEGAIWCSGTQGVSLIDSAVTSNVGGGMGVFEGCTLVSENTDWGNGVTDNDSFDVWMWYQDIYYHDYGANEPFTCEGTGVCL